MTHITKDTEHLFDRFTARALNTSQVIRDAGAIVQNSGVELSDKDIDDWATETTQRLLVQYQKQLQLVTDTVEALKVM